MKRYQHDAIVRDLEKKMIFLVGPRQAGKTWLSRQIAEHFKYPVYLNYDSLTDRKVMLGEYWLEKTDLLILDELHKMPQWKNYLKGIYDTKLPHLRILVTGSARLDIFTEVGDSLAGRYFCHHLLPVSLAELKKTNQSIHFDTLLSRGGFPEPLLAEDDVEAARWRMQYIDSLLREDILVFDNIQNIRAIRLVFELLRTKVGTPVSYKSIAEDAHISPTTVAKYINILEDLYIIFKVTPFSKNIARSILKEPKIYFFDNGLVQGDAGAQLENFVALSLKKHVYGLRDYQAKPYELHYLRTKEKQEVDFAIADLNKIHQIIEVKNKDSTISSALKSFHQKYQLNACQIVKQLKHNHQIDGIEIIKAQDFLEDLYL